jgi:hypothetical protein
MPGEMLTTDELDQLGDLSGAALYRAEVKRIPFLTRAEEAAYIEAARTGSVQARNVLICDCLHYTLYKAGITYKERQPPHSDIMDLISHAHVTLLETFPKALAAEKPVKYLMSVAAIELRLYCTYDDPLIRRPRTQPFSSDHPRTVSLEETQLVAATASEHMAEVEYWLVYDAVHELTEQRRDILIAVYGLFGQPKTSIEDIAALRQLKVATVKNYLWRAKTKLARQLGPYVLEKWLQTATT